MKSLYFIFVSLACYSVCLAESVKDRFLRLNLLEIDQLAAYASGNIFGPGEGGESAIYMGIYLEWLASILLYQLV
ncbi:MAG: hypothetical protein O7C75_12860 [Verrucomicrobia bacterium]|nr:hypothetical protein [Verrucomicrobiota bacterium]